MKRYLLFLLTLYSTCMAAPAQEETMIVWVHGTLPPINIRESLKKDKSWYSKSYAYFPFQPIGKDGLHPVDESSKTIPALYSSLYREVSRQFKLHSNENIKFHTFSWSGSLSDRSRKRWADRLYRSLSGKHPKRIICIGHSHGGNIILNLAKSEKKLKQGLVIDEALLYAVPVQSETKDCIESDVFKKIYSFYSKGDKIQVADIFSTGDFFSKRTFKQNKIMPSKKLVEIEVLVDGRKPNHGEFWLTGYTPLNIYRKSFSMHPAPICIFSPLFTNHVKLPSNNLRLRINTRENSWDLRFEDRKTNKPIRYNFLSPGSIKDLINNWVSQKLETFH